MISESLRKEIVVTAVKKLFRPDGHFCIIDFDSLMATAKVSVPKSTRESLRCLHCVHYSDMTLTMKTELIATVMNLLGSGPDPMHLLQEALGGKPQTPAIQFNPNWFQKLLGKA